MRYVILVLISLCLIGCKVVSDSIDYYKACKGDLQCIESMEANRKLAATIVSKSVDVNTQGNSLGWIFGSLAGNLVAFLTGVWRGKKLKEV